jgi:hypothetical protein
MPEEQEEIISEKANQVAFFSLRKLHITPFVKPDGRVAFNVKGNISEVLAELQTNPLIPLLDYIQRLETIRSLIFTLKQGKEDDKKTGHYKHSKY